MVVHVDYAQGPNGLEFALPTQRKQQLRLANAFVDKSVVFKIQCTNSKKFRVRPALAVMRPQTAIAVQVQLAPQEQTESESKFLIIVREIPTSLAAAGQVGKTEEESMLKAMWKALEKHEPSTLIFSETIPAKISIQMNTDPTSTEQLISLPSATTPPSSMIGQQTTLLEQPSSMAFPVSFNGGNNPTEVSEHNTQMALPPIPNRNSNSTTLEYRAEIVRLLMKDQSRKATNKLSREELDRLLDARWKATPDEWRCWQMYATRMRILIRDRKKRREHH